MRPNSVVFVLSLLFFAFACTFMLDEPTGLTHIDNTVSAKDSISLALYENVDTIYLSANKPFLYNVTNVLGSYVAEVYFDGNLVYTFTDRNGSFIIPDLYIKTGTHKLKISLNESYTDKTLISQFTYRQYSIFREWVVIIDMDPPAAFEIKASIENGYLKYTWPEYEKSDFTYYYVEGNPRNSYVNRSVQDPTKNFFYDSAYIDGSYPSGITVTVNNTHGSSQATAAVSELPVKFDMVFHQEDTTASFTWNKPKYRGNFKSYNISDAVSPMASVTSVTDTTLTLDIKGVFPAVTQIFFKMFDKDGKVITTIEKDITYFLGNAMPSDQTSNLFWFYSKAANKYIGRSGPDINIYDASFNLIGSRSVQDNAFYGMTMAWPGNYIHYIGSGYSISQLNLVNNNETSMTIAGDYINPAFVNVVSGADNQVVSFSAIDNDHVHPADDINGIVDLQAGGVLQQSKTGTWTSLSDDGRYSVTESGVYSVSSGTLTHNGTIPNGYRFRWFRGDNTDEIITTQYDAQVANELKTVIVRSSDMTILRSFDPPEAGFSMTSYDPSIKTLLYTKIGASKVYVINIETGKKSMLNVNGSFNTPLVNGNIIVGARYMKIP
jgi:hypothetical protein